MIDYVFLMSAVNPSSLHFRLLCQTRNLVASRLGSESLAGLRTRRAGGDASRLHELCPAKSLPGTDALHSVTEQAAY